MKRDSSSSITSRTIGYIQRRSDPCIRVGIREIYRRYCYSIAFIALKSTLSYDW